MSELLVGTFAERGADSQLLREACSGPATFVRLPFGRNSCPEGVNAAEIRRSDTRHQEAELHLPHQRSCSTLKAHGGSEEADKWPCPTTTPLV